MTELLASKRNLLGYTIVEMSIVLVVLGLLLSSVLLPLSAYFRNEQVRETNRLLKQIEDSLLGYAMSANTIPRFVIGRNNSQVVSNAMIPAGRPYLPCPDVTGDGLENRNSLNAIGRPAIAPGINVQVDATLPSLYLTRQLYLPYLTGIGQTLTIAADGLANSITTGPNGTDPDNVAYGECASDKGAVPWATLGVPATDPWGNLITYRVDPMFSHSAIGFGIETRADMMDLRFPLNVIENNNIKITTYTRRATALSETRTKFADYNLLFFQDNLPGIVCTNISNTNDQGCSANSSQLEKTDIINLRTAVDLTTYDVFAHLTVARIHPADDILNGMAFILVSHGANGNGALRLPLNPISQTNTNDRLIRCPILIGEVAYTATLPELENADFARQCNDVDTRIPASVLSPSFHGFVEQPSHNKYGNNNVLIFDDELRYISGQQLIGALLNRGRDFGAPWVPPLVK